MLLDTQLSTERNRDIIRYYLIYFTTCRVSETSEPVNKVYLSSLLHGLSGLKGTHTMLWFVKLVDEFEAY
jgi:hypothetical protein